VLANPKKKEYTSPEVTDLADAGWELIKGELETDFSKIVLFFPYLRSKCGPEWD